MIVGTPEQIADSIELWQAAGIDGINVINWVIPGSFEEFADKVLPVLRERGLAQSEYSPGALRHKLFGTDRLSGRHPAAAYPRAFGGGVRADGAVDDSPVKEQSPVRFPDAGFAWVVGLTRCAGVTEHSVRIAGSSTNHTSFASCQAVCETPGGVCGESECAMTISAMKGKTATGRQSYPLGFKVEFLQAWDAAVAERGGRTTRTAVVISQGLTRTLEKRSSGPESSSTPGRLMD